MMRETHTCLDTADGMGVDVLDYEGDSAESMEELIRTLSRWISHYGYENGYQNSQFKGEKERLLDWLDGQGGMARDHWRRLLHQDYKHSPSLYTVWRVCAVVGAQVLIDRYSVVLERADAERIQITMSVSGR
jgi:hypothetical protein